MPFFRRQKRLTAALILPLSRYDSSTVALATPSVLKHQKKTQTSRLFGTRPPSTSSSLVDVGNVNGAVDWCEEISPSVEKTPLFSLERLRQVSNFASLLCVLDCTLLPIVTVALPLLGILNLGASQLEFIHHLGHAIALYFVLPVGGLTGVVNYMSHKKAWITCLSGLGLVLVGLANSHLHSLPLVGHVEFLHTIQHGMLHRFANTLGCALLLGSNYLSQKQPGCAHGPACSSHGHGRRARSRGSHNHDH